MAKARSHAYPAIGLREAVDCVADIYRNDYQNPIPRLVAAQHMGYNGLNGKSLSVLSALSKYGLLEGRGDDTRVSNLAVTIIAHPPGSAERAAALKSASEKPELFAELDSRFQGGKASEQAIRSYLLTQKFIPVAADAAIRSYRESKELVDAEGGEYHIPAPKEGNVTITVPSAPLVTSSIAPSVGIHRASGAEPFRVSFDGKAVEVTGRLTTPEDADEFVRAVQALKVLMRPAGETKRPEWADKTFSPGERSPADCIWQAHHHGHVGSGQIELAKGDMFPGCNECVGGNVRYTVA